MRTDIIKGKFALSNTLIPFSVSECISSGADSDTFERGGVNLNLAFDVASKSILRSSKYQKKQTKKKKTDDSTLIRAAISNYLPIFF